MHASQVGQHFNLHPNFELLKRCHYPIIPTGMRSNIKGRWQPGHRCELFHWSIITLWFCFNFAGSRGIIIYCLEFNSLNFVCQCFEQWKMDACLLCNNFFVKVEGGRGYNKRYISKLTSSEYTALGLQKNWSKYQVQKSFDFICNNLPDKTSDWCLRKTVSMLLNRLTSWPKCYKFKSVLLDGISKARWYVPCAYSCARYLTISIVICTVRQQLLLSK